MFIGGEIIDCVVLKLRAPHNFEFVYYNLKHQFPWWQLSVNCKTWLSVEVAQFSQTKMCEN